MTSRAVPPDDTAGRDRTEQALRLLFGVPVVLLPEDEARLTAWMHAHLRLTWAEDAEPATIEAALVRRLHPPLNVSGVNPEHIQAAVVAAKNAYNSASGPADPSPRP